MSNRDQSVKINIDYYMLMLIYIYIYIYIFFFLSFSHGDFYTILDLPEGDHQYKFFVDGQWLSSPVDVSKTCWFFFSMLFFLILVTYFIGHFVLLLPFKLNFGSIVNHLIYFVVYIYFVYFFSHILLHIYVYIYIQKF